MAPSETIAVSCLGDVECVEVWPRLVKSHDGQWNDGQGRRESEQRLAAVSIGEVADDRRDHQRTQPGDGLLQAGEVDGEGALVLAGAERRHGHVGDHRRHHEGAHAEEEGEHQ